MLHHAATQIDFAPYAGQRVIVGCAPSPERKDTPYYVLGVLGEELPEAVKAIIIDEADEASEMLFVVAVDGQGQCEHWAPLVVFDIQGRLRYGIEYLHALVQRGEDSVAYTVRCVHLD